MEDREAPGEPGRNRSPAARRRVRRAASSRLKVGSADDLLEREADASADAVMRWLAHPRTSAVGVFAPERPTRIRRAVEATDRPSISRASVIQREELEDLVVKTGTLARTPSRDKPGVGIAQRNAEGLPLEGEMEPT